MVSGQREGKRCLYMEEHKKIPKKKKGKKKLVVGTWGLGI